MQTILRISDAAVQEVIQQMNQIFLLSKPFLSNGIQQSHYKWFDFDLKSILKDIVKVVTE